MSRKLALIPGTFNPVHRGHLLIAEHQSKLGEVPTFLISAYPFDKKDLPSPVERLKPISSAGYYTSIVESRSILGQLTEVFGQLFFKNYTPPEVSVNVGMDTFVRINNRDYYYDPLHFEAFADVLRIEGIQINVFPRPNSTKPTVDPLLLKQVNFVEDFEAVDISSTKIRNAKCGLS